MTAAQRIGIAVSPGPASFAPLLFAGRLEEAVASATDLGLTCLELSVRDPAAVDAQRLRALLEEAGLVASAIATGQGCLADGLCLLSADDRVRAAAIERFKAQAALAAELGAAVILGGVRGRLGASAAELPRRRATAVETVRACVEAAAGLGAEVLLEPINRYETDFVTNAEEGLALIDEVESASFRLLLDTFHMNIEEVRLGHAIREAENRLGYLHVADSNRQAPGQGHVDFEEVAEALAEIDYAGPVVAEILPLPDDATAARRAAAFLARAAGAAPDRPRSTSGSSDEEEVNAVSSSLEKA